MSDRTLDSEALDQAMNEAVLLPDQDPRRLEVMKRVVEAGGEWERQWLDLVAEDQELRLDLQRVSVPAGLADRLRRLPQQAPQSMSWPRFRRVASWLSAAAVIGVGVFWMVGVGSSPAMAFDRISRFAAKHHAYHKATPMRFSSPRSAELGELMDGLVEFAVRPPDMGAGYRLVGAEICTLDRRQIICTKWELQGRVYTVFQFHAPDFRLPRAFTPRRLGPEDAPGAVAFWTEGNCAYAMVADPAPDAG